MESTHVCHNWVRVQKSMDSDRPYKAVWLNSLKNYAITAATTYPHFSTSDHSLPGWWCYWLAVTILPTDRRNTTPQSSFILRHKLLICPEQVKAVGNGWPRGPRTARFTLTWTSLATLTCRHINGRIVREYVTLACRSTLPTLGRAGCGRETDLPFDSLFRVGCRSSLQIVLEI